MRKILLIVVVGWWGGWHLAARATTYTVNPGESIQTAIDGASYGDTVEVAIGAYAENITLKNGVVLIGYGATVVGKNDGSVVISVACDPNTILEGFVITSGYGGFAGGGMLNNGSSPTVSNCTFSGNSVVNGGGICNVDSSPMVTNCTFSGNSAGGSGGGMRNYNSNPTITNCIFWGNHAAEVGNEIYNDSTLPIISFCDIAGCGGSGAGWDTSLGNDAGGNIDIDPLFANPDNDFHLKSQFGRGSSNPAEPFITFDSVKSPCIDAGDPTMNVGNETTDNGERINMGAYGGTKQASRSGFNADTNGDGMVNLLDLAILAAHWLKGST
ncbi:hypothetical protein ACFL02_01905 [Planctomycetota bacterium]